MAEPAPTSAPIGEPHKGDVIAGKYLVERVIAEGGMGVVVEAMHLTLNRRVAVKLMLAQWEREFPGRTESIFSAIGSVEVEHLADPRRFDFASLKASARESSAVEALVAGVSHAAGAQTAAAALVATDAPDADT